MADSREEGGSGAHTIPTRSGDRRTTRRLRSTPPSGQRAGRRELTHIRMLQCAIELIRTEGVGAVTVSRIAKRIEVHHSLFYTHFESIDECLAQAAAHVVANLVPIDVQMRGNLETLRVEERAEFLKDALDRWLVEKPFVELALSARLDRSAFGRALRPTLDALRDSIVGEVRVLATRCGVDARRMDGVDHIGDALYGQWLWGLETVVSGRCSDTGEVALMVADNMTGICTQGLRRLMQPASHELVRARFTGEQITQMRTRQDLVRRELTGPDAPVEFDVFGGASAVTDACMNAIADHFIPAAAGGRYTRVLYRVLSRGESYARMVIVGDGACRWEATEGAAQTTLTLSLKTLLACLAGKRTYTDAFNRGDMEVTGDVLFSMEFERWFYLPGSAVDRKVG